MCGGGGGAQHSFYRKIGKVTYLSLLIFVICSTELYQPKNLLSDQMSGLSLTYIHGNSPAKGTEYSIYLAIRQGFPLSRMTANN